VKLVVTVLTRDQADIVDAVVAYHLHAGADLVIATDHRSEDGTTEILESYERDGVLRLIRQPGDEVRTQEWRTAMARMAAELGADWVIGCDGDEFWWPCSGSLKEVLAAVPERFGVVDGPWRFFLPRPGGHTFFAERMVVRLTPRGALEHPRSQFRPRAKIAHRARTELVLQGGNHHLIAGGLAPLPSWHPLEVFHFPSRSRAQHAKKHERWEDAGRNWRSARARITSPQDSYDYETIDDERLARGLELGSLAIDTRLRDVLREILGHDRGEDEFEDRQSSPSSTSDSSLAADRAALFDHDLLRLGRRLDDLRARASACERG